MTVDGGVQRSSASDSAYVKKTYIYILCLRIQIRENLLQSIKSTFLRNWQHFWYFDTFLFLDIFCPTLLRRSQPVAGSLAPPPTRSTIAASRSWFICSHGGFSAKKNGRLISRFLAEIKVLLCSYSSNKEHLNVKGWNKPKCASNVLFSQDIILFPWEENTTFPCWVSKGAHHNISTSGL